MARIFLFLILLENINFVLDHPLRSLTMFPPSTVETLTQVYQVPCHLPPADPAPGGAEVAPGLVAAPLHMTGQRQTLAVTMCLVIPYLRLTPGLSALAAGWASGFRHRPTVAGRFLEVGL